MEGYEKYIKIEEFGNRYDVINYLERNNIKFDSTDDPMDFVCEEYVDKYIDDYNALKPLFIKMKPEIVEHVKDKGNQFIDTDAIYLSISESIDKICDIIKDRNF